MATQKKPAKPPLLHRAPKPMPGDIEKHHVRAAARYWDRGDGFLNFASAKRYYVWIDAQEGGPLHPYPPKAIVTMAGCYARKRPLRTNEFSGNGDGPWHERLKALGFDVSPICGPVAVGGKQSRPLAPREMRTALRGKAPVLVEQDDGDAVLEKLLQQPGLPTTTRREVQARLGQGKFRDGLLAAYGERCMLSGIAEPAALRAAHIHRWADCHQEPQARHDLQNGLLLSANLDSLFEVGLIAFDDRGQIMISPTLGADTRAQFGLHDAMQLPGPVSARRQRYLRLHRQRIKATWANPRLPK